jgi:hypothetical protein
MVLQKTTIFIQLLFVSIGSIKYNEDEDNAPHEFVVQKETGTYGNDPKK